MPIIQGGSGWAEALGALAGGAGNFIAGREEARQKKAQLDQALAYQKWLMQNGKSQTAIQAANAGVQYDPNTGAVTPFVDKWNPNAGVPTSGGIAPGPGAPPPGAPVQSPATLGAAVGTAAAASPPPKAGASGIAPPPSAQPAAPQTQSAGFTAQADVLLRMAHQEQAHADSLRAQGAPTARYEKTQARADALLAQAGEWYARGVSAETAERNNATAERALKLQQDEKAFAGHEMALPTDMTQALSVLRKRQQAERAHGFSDLESGTESQIKDYETRLHQDKIDAENRDYQRKNLGLRQEAITVRVDGQNSGDGAAYESVMRHIKGMKPADAIAYIGNAPLSNAQFNRAMAVVKGEQAAAKVPKVPEADQRGIDFNSGVKAIASAPDDKRDEIRDTVVKQYAAKYKIKIADAEALFDQ